MQILLNYIPFLFTQCQFRILLCILIWCENKPQTLHLSCSVWDDKEGVTLRFWISWVCRCWGECIPWPPFECGLQLIKITDVFTRGADENGTAVLVANVREKSMETRDRQPCKDHWLKRLGQNRHHTLLGSEYVAKPFGLVWKHRGYQMNMHWDFQWGGVATPLWIFVK